MSALVRPPAPPQGLHRSTLPLQILAALVLGVLVGLLWPTFALRLQPLGSAFISAVKMVVIPLIFCAVALGAMKMGHDAPRLGRVALSAFVWFYLASAIAVCIGLCLNAIFHPASGVHLGSGAGQPPKLANGIDWVKFLLDLIPSNVVAAMAEQRVLPTLLFAVLFGLGLAAVGERGRPMAQLLDSILAVMFRITNWIVAIAPLAVFAMMAWLLAAQGLATVLALMKLVLVMYCGYVLFALLCMGGFALLGESALGVTRQILSPVLLAFVTRSSEVALPLHLETLEGMGIPNRIAAVVLPLGYSFNLDGSALYIGLATSFIAEAYGLHLSLPQLLTILGTALIASKGVANVPAASLIALSTVLLALGLPADAIALIAGVDVLLDMGRTGLNIFGNTLAVLVARRFTERTVATTI